jgi:hypothetical protein
VHNLNQPLSEIELWNEDLIEQHSKKLFSEHAILASKVLNRVQLSMIDPAFKNQEQQLPGVWYEFHMNQDGCSYRKTITSGIGSRLSIVADNEIPQLHPSSIILFICSSAEFYYLTSFWKSRECGNSTQDCAL